jgi:hypothetical protein
MLRSHLAFILSRGATAIFNKETLNKAIKMFAGGKNQKCFKNKIWSAFILTK